MWIVIFEPKLRLPMLTFTNVNWLTNNGWIYQCVLKRVHAIVNLTSLFKIGSSIALNLASSMLLCTWQQMLRTIEKFIKAQADFIVKCADKSQYASYQHIIWNQWVWKTWVRVWIGKDESRDGQANGAHQRFTQTVEKMRWVEFKTLAQSNLL